MSTEHIYTAVIVGAGFGGLGQGAQFVQDGIDDFVILERAHDLGGVWRDNTYPGAACDTQSVIYCYSYLLNLGVSRMFAGQAELLGYLRRLADEFGLMERIHLGSDVTEAVWSEDERLWRIRTSAGRSYLARAFVPAWGQLSTPFIPDIPGAGDFAGESFHSASWRHDLDLRGQRVASIGAAATAVQYVPEVAPLASQLTVFQRSANYILPREQRVFSADETREFIAKPQTYMRLRHEIHDLREDGFVRIRRGTEASHEGAALARAHLEAQVTDPELRSKLTPDYDYGCKRILRSDDFYPALNRTNVDVVTASIDAITPTGVRTVDGVEREFDVIVYATGFKSQAFQAGMRVVGRAGRTLDDRWGTAPEAYLGITVDGFPNMFLVYGPNTNLNHNSVVSMLEAQHRYIAQCVRHLSRSAEHVLEVDAQVLREFSTRIQGELERSAFSSECSSWYKNDEGRVINNWSGTVEEYRVQTRKLELADFGAGS
ncbi:NAD(P)/FAD-dependent oxidoreductase [Herbiconiux sp. KACC 21604]|uniref:flavin-containing monooxygenase n=1 Tax=unclassified Herbiconiux TaxID=2618217 RepID=UPI0014917DAC|nr:NAD(P)/FAD-dependent oxidoreductase [Herbiconiux sp. SALV-R1]QJU54778.1 NAD(P)/FAD-dependent oxidoreductase [Herbiconiux sp. SALV-R1]WPO85888.1 NAD(P)/FAD-dependent oxidoreductase [Herbiconiux sp. KACC 21604]